MTQKTYTGWFAAAGCLGVIPLMVAVVGIFSFYQGWVLTYLWRWFIVPLGDIPALTIWHAAGIMLTIRMIAPRGTKNEDIKWSMAISAPIIALGMGWLIHWMMS